MDADEGDANQRMITINQRAVKKDYQDIVELSFLNRENGQVFPYYEKHGMVLKLLLKENL